ncbi:hypothetical protein QUF50_05045 [Thiotrichales bacterium HSG1]|nr:hypothetical protein [Thiotrichales bacterium HSG1]
MDLDKIQSLLDSIAVKDNGVSGVYVIDAMRGELIARNDGAGSDGNVNWEEIDNVLSSFIDIWERLSHSDSYNLGESKTMSFDFENGGIIVTDTGEAAMIFFVNLNPKKMGPANRTATIETKNIAKLLK